nr:MAG TPA: hypothetical protein [Bacteriophage sp.]
MQRKENPMNKKILPQLVQISISQKSFALKMPAMA